VIRLEDLLDILRGDTFAVVDDTRQAPGKMSAGSCLRRETWLRPADSSFAMPVSMTDK
jgi:hypothetical protein